jgi:hypothetical protein
MFHHDISIYIYICIHIYMCVYVLYPSLVHPIHYSPFPLTPSLKMNLTGFSIPYSYMSKKYFNHIHPSLPSSFNPLSYNYPSLNMAHFTFLSFIILVSIHC